ncbi:hypothetical protein K9M59_04420 [Candidatus Gracilibacteria bacterium]|nr:hypothetical protein [Candidatus Gracilibacteria bacterium]MCF7819564.1 hypothetical protein [Candidatus Gracilibacteria bacterium]
MFYFHKKHEGYKRLLSLSLLFALLPALIWIDILYDFFRDVILMPLYYSIPDSLYLTIMLIFPIAAFVFSLWGYCKTPKQERTVALFMVALSAALILLMTYILSPLGEKPLVG